MNQQTAKNSNECPRTAIAAYIDGELASGEELELEMHFAVCELCTAELNRHKKLLHALDFALEEEKEFELPENFTKVIIANAESKVSGLRHPKERFNALFICSILFLLVILGLGSETETVFGAFGKFFEQFLVVCGFIAHLAFDISVGITVILRTICLQVVYKSAFATALLLILCGFCAVAFSRLVFRYNRI
jgi:predicted anti-sigma-YlaC factor YlaD